MTDGGPACRLAQHRGIADVPVEHLHLAEFGQVTVDGCVGLGEDPPDVERDRATGDIELGGDLAVGQTLGDQRDHFTLPLTEPLQDRIGRTAGIRSQRPGPDPSGHDIWKLLPCT